MADPATEEIPPLVLVPPAKQTLAEDIAGRLREAIIRGRFAPGQRLREEQLASALEVSRGPVRRP